MSSVPMIPLTRMTNEAENIFRHLGTNDEPLVVSLDGHRNLQAFLVNRVLREKEK